VPDIVLATGRQMPHGPPVENGLLVAALAARGVSATIEPWGTPASLDAPLVVVRTTWDYTDHVAEFLAWVDAVGRRTRLANPAEVIRWNHHKSYLLELAGAGIPVIPTTIVSQPATPADVAAALAEHRGDVVIKPAVSVGAIDTIRAAATSPDARDHLARLVASGDVLLQPFEPAISDGEVSLIYFGGELSHAVRKVPAPGDYRVQAFYGGEIRPHEPGAAQLEVGACALEAVSVDPAYARVDLVNTPRGPLLMELELIEPQLFLDESNDSAARFADTLVTSLR
jgi:glutathione synthase/RimK-type ligase-like ATP-grasp enzyme